VQHRIEEHADPGDRFVWTAEMSNPEKRGTLARKTLS
jgi:hypothetical protein